VARIPPLRKKTEEANVDKTTFVFGEESPCSLTSLFKIKKILKAGAEIRIFKRKIGAVMK